jgi:preprotein translocase subunit YajC
LTDLLAGPFPLLIAFGLLTYFLLFRPQQQRQKKHQQQIEAIKRGDTVVLSSGVIGQVTRVDDKEATVEISPKVEIKVVKAMISDVRTRGAPAAANDPKPKTTTKA